MPSDAILFRVIDLLVREKRRVSEVPGIINQEFSGVRLTREMFYPLLPKARASRIPRKTKPLGQETAEG